MLVLLGVLIGVIVGLQCTGEYLYRTYLKKESLATVATTGATKDTSKVVVIDAGHGGFDPGKIGINQALEKDINLQIAKKVQAQLEEQGITVIMTREDENELASSKTEDMKERVRIINENNPDLAVSIHQNSYTSESIHGAQVFYYKHSSEGEKIAKIMQNALLSVDSENKRQAKDNDTYYMLKKTEKPVVIVECGFLSNQAEADLLITDTYQESLATAITDGIMTYLGVEKK
jgi:N-acetylmuramoyl-L-alanine amidase